MKQITMAVGLKGNRLIATDQRPLGDTVVLYFDDAFCVVTGTVYPADIKKIHPDKLRAGKMIIGTSLFDGCFVLEFSDNSIVRIIHFFKEGLDPISREDAPQYLDRWKEHKDAFAQLEREGYELIDATMTDRPLTAKEVVELFYQFIIDYLDQKKIPSSEEMVRYFDSLISRMSE